MERSYWTPDDYNNVIREIDFNTPNGERYPELSNPETAAVFSKLTDHQNYLVVVNDEALGLNHRNNVSSEFFSQYKKLNKLYSSLDRQDKYVYGREVLEIRKWGLELQLHYFKLGNEVILDDADDPESGRIVSLVSGNERTLFDNYNSFLELTDEEKAFDEEVIAQLSNDLVPYYKMLFESFPNGDLSITRKKLNLMKKKVKHPALVKALDDLEELMNQYQPQAAADAG